MSKPGKVLKELCKRLGVRLTIKRGKKRVYKSVTVLKKQCAKKKKVVKRKGKKKVKRKRKFGARAVAEHRGLSMDLQRLIEEYIGPGPQALELRARIMDELVVHRLRPPRLQRQVAQEDFGEYNPDF